MPISPARATQPQLRSSQVGVFDFVTIVFLFLTGRDEPPNVGVVSDGISQEFAVQPSAVKRVPELSQIFLQGFGFALQTLRSTEDFRNLIQLLLIEEVAEPGALPLVRVLHLSLGLRFKVSRMS